MATIKNCRLIQQRGFSLIELMISIPLGLLVMFAVLKIFTANVEGVNLQNAFSRVQENGRMATELLIRDIRGADYWGCLRDTSQITNNLDSSDSDYDEDQIPSGKSGVAGENDVSSTTIASITVKDETDTLTLRSANSIANIKLVSPYMTAGTIHISPGVDIPQGTILMIGDCAGADLFSNPNNNIGVLGQILQGTDPIAISGAVNNATGSFSRQYSSTAQLMTPHVKTYFIGLNPAGSYSLFRTDDGVANELVRGVNDLQLLYGEDTNSNGAPDSFSVATAVTNMDNVRAIRLSLVVESGSSSADVPLTRIYTLTSNIRNRTLK